MTHRSAAVVFALAVLLCNCDQPSTTSSTGAASATSSHTLAPWTLGAARDDNSWSLPIPCSLAKPPLRASIPPPTAIFSIQNSLGHLVVGARRLGSKAAERSFGLLRMKHGTAAEVGAFKTADPTPRVARNGNQWLIATLEQKRLQLSNGHRVRSWPADRLIGLRCRKKHGCAVLSTLAGGLQIQAIGYKHNLTAWRPPEALGAVSAGLGAQLVQLSSSRGNGPIPNVRITLQRGRHVRALTWPRHTLAEAVVHQRLEAKQQLLAAHAEWTVVGPIALDSECSVGSSNVVLVHRDGRHYPLPSPTPPQHLKVTEMGSRILISWLAAPHCSSQARTLYAWVADAKTGPLGPVTAVAGVTNYATASIGERLDMWLLERGRVTFLRLRCPLSAPSKLTPSNEATARPPRR